MKDEKRISLASQYMESFHKTDYSGHDIAHVYRVHSMAKHIAYNEAISNTLIIELASLLHDTIDAKLVDTTSAKQHLNQFLDKLEITHSDQSHILHIIENMSYKNGANNHVELTVEGQVVRDADRLDAIGAIGIARTFQFAGHFKEPMWTESKLPKNFNDDTLSTLSPSAIKHFYEKLFKLKDLMHTNTAKQIAIQRHDFMEHFVSQFLSEWHQL